MLFTVDTTTLELSAVPLILISLLDSAAVENGETERAAGAL